MSDCEERTQDGRRCLRPNGHRQQHAFEGLPDKQCTCMLRWHPNRCEAHPEKNG